MISAAHDVLSFLNFQSFFAQHSFRDIFEEMLVGTFFEEMLAGLCDIFPKGGAKNGSQMSE